MYLDSINLLPLQTGDISMITDCMLRLYTICVLDSTNLLPLQTGDISMITDCMLRLYTICV